MYVPLLIFFFSLCNFLGLDVGVSQEVELEEEGEDGGGRESEAAGTSEDVMRRKQELKLDLGPDYVFLFSLNSLRFSLTSETDKKKKLFNFSKLQFLNDEICHLHSNLANW